MLDLSEKGIYLLCNSLNAYSGAARLRNEPKAADMLLRAQGTTARLFEENKQLKEQLESRKGKEKDDDT